MPTASNQTPQKVKQEVCYPSSNRWSDEHWILWKFRWTNLQNQDKDSDLFYSKQKNKGIRPNLKGECWVPALQSHTHIPPKHYLKTTVDMKACPPVRWVSFSITLFNTQKETESYGSRERWVDTKLAHNKSQDLKGSCDPTTPSQMNKFTI